MKKNLFITQNCTIHREHKSLKIVLESEVKSIPLSIVDNLFLIGNSVKLTNGARGLLLENNKNIFFYTSSYKMQGVLSNTKLQSNYRNRLLQYDASKNCSLEVAKHIVVHKITSVEKYFNLKLQKYTSPIYGVTTLSEVLGYEGIASNKMFQKFKKHLHKHEITFFEKREYRPTKDRVNGILSFTYTLYSNLLYGLVLAEGFDPYLGFLHKKRGTHYAFVSDLIEYDRAKLTVFVAHLFTQNVLRDEHFESIYLNKEGRQVFLKHFNHFCDIEFENSKANLHHIAEQFV
jgi:CRISPR-associated protein Cas1